jgi:hypothetical protein
MTTRIIKVESSRATWYEIQIRLLWLFWVDANMLKPGFCSVYLNFEEAMDKLDDLKRQSNVKKTIQCTVQL